jgi:lactoylglutathione lyase
MTDKPAAHRYPISYKDFVYGLNSKRPQILHTMLCIKDIEASSRFYIDGLGMTLFDRMEFDFAPRISALFVGFDAHEGVLELSHYPDNDGEYSQVRGWGHVAIGVPDLDAILARLKGMGIEPKKVNAEYVPGAPRAAFLNDPDGYEIELIQTHNG